MKYRASSNSGAKEGLRQKMDYWKDRDFKTEFNILVSQALNLVMNLKEFRDFPLKHDEVIDEAKRFFYILLELRKDEGLRKFFQEYREGGSRESASALDKQEIKE